VKRFIFFHGERHPKEMGGPEVEAFLSDLANEGKVAVSTHLPFTVPWLCFWIRLTGPGFVMPRQDLGSCLR
jgi:hypothetical protein